MNIAQANPFKFVPNSPVGVATLRELESTTKAMLTAFDNHEGFDQNPEAGIFQADNVTISRDDDRGMTAVRSTAKSENSVVFLDTGAAINYYDDGPDASFAVVTNLQNPQDHWVFEISRRAGGDVDFSGPIAIIDTGIDYNHGDLKKNLWQ